MFANYPRNNSIDRLEAIGLRRRDLRPSGDRHRPEDRVVAPGWVSDSGRELVDFAAFYIVAKLVWQGTVDQAYQFAEAPRDPARRRRAGTTV